MGLLATKSSGLTVLTGLRDNEIARADEAVQLGTGGSNTHVIEIPVILTAVPTEYTVTFESNGGSAVASLTNVLEDTVIAEPTAPVKAEYEFAGWYKEADLSNQWNFAVDTVQSDITLYAKWEPIPSIDTYTVTFNSNGGTEVAAITNIEKGSHITEPTVPTRADYIFAGWYKEGDLKNQWNFAVDTVESDITLHAKWESIPSVDTYTVTFNSNGGTKVTALTNIEKGSHITEPKAPTRADYTFVGWYKEADLKNQWDFAVDIVESDITLYAKWNNATGIETYKVTFNSNGGSKVAPLTNIEAGSPIAEPKAPTKTGYTFAGWFKEAKCENRWDFAADTVKSDITLYAKWEKVSSPAPRSPGTPRNNQPTSRGPKGSYQAPKTGDETMLFEYGVVVLAAVASIMILISKKRYSN